MIRFFRRSSAAYLSTLFLSIFLAQTGNANIVGTKSQNFNTTASSDDYVTVHSAKTLGMGNFSLGLFINNAVNSLPYFVDDESKENADYEYEGASRGKYNDSVLSSDLGIGYGVFKNVDIGLNIPMILYQDIRDDEQPHGEFEKRGVTEYRISSKIRAWGNRFYGLAFVGSANVGATENDPYSGEGGGPTYNAEVVNEFDLGLMSFAINAGYRWKSAGKTNDDTPIEPYKNQFIGSAAAGVDIKSLSSRFITEVYASSPTESLDDKSDRHTTAVEAITGLRISGSKGMAYDIGGGTELRHSVATPDWRLYAGLTWKAPLKRNSSATVRIVDNPPPAEKPAEVFVNRDILFKFDSAQIDGEGSFSFFDALSRSLDTKGYDRLEIEGHTCSLGSHVYNQKLSQKRAEAIRQVLIEKFGLDPQKVTAIGYGEIRPIATNKTDKGRKLNRRVEFKIYRQDEQLTNASPTKISPAVQEL